MEVWHIIVILLSLLVFGYVAIATIVYLLLESLALRYSRILWSITLAVLLIFVSVVLGASSVALAVTIVQSIVLAVLLTRMHSRLPSQRPPPVQRRVRSQIEVSNLLASKDQEYLDRAARIVQDVSIRSLVHKELARRNGRPLLRIVQ